MRPALAGTLRLKIVDADSALPTESRGVRASLKHQ
jgi:hypothetical protein